MASKFSHPRVFILDKRQKFVASTLLLSVLFFSIQMGSGGVGFGLIFLLAFLTMPLFYWAMHKDISEKSLLIIFLLPFLYSLAFGLFYFLIPTRILFRLILTIVYGIGLYSLFLSQNIFVVAAIRTIALLTGARIVSFVITILSYLLLVNTILSFHFAMPFTLLLLALATFLLTYHSLWTYTLQKTPYRLSVWAGGLTLCLVEVASVLFFWPSTPTVLALYLTGMLYIFLGLSHMWMEKRLFKNVLWEFSWVSLIAFLFLMLFTSWGK
ncbi:MAG TPA: hypothetical protein VMR41_03165 [Patescibacteria group bacterium]|nr:hypothetical protein [Patescibacteria group bacterium]